MAENKMIEEMAKIVAVQRGYGCNEQDHCDMSCQVFKVGCIPYGDAQILYDAGYRKQSEGEWETLKKTNFDSLNMYSHICSVCNCLYTDIRPYGHKFCHNCGSKMKGETE